MFQEKQNRWETNGERSVMRSRHTALGLVRPPASSPRQGPHSAGKAFQLMEPDLLSSRSHPHRTWRQLDGRVVQCPGPVAAQLRSRPSGGAVLLGACWASWGEVRWLRGHRPGWAGLPFQEPGHWARGQGLLGPDRGAPVARNFCHPLSEGKGPLPPYSSLFFVLRGNSSEKEGTGS